MLPDLRYLGVILSLVLVYTISVPEPASADVVGLVKRIKGDAYGTPPEMEREKKYLRFPVVQRELLETDSGSGMLVQFLDKTTLTLGPNSSLAIDTFVYDPQSHRGTSVINLTLGMLRFVSGKMVSDDVQIKTPSTVIGIRGSDALIVVSKTGATTVSVFDGRFSVSNLDGSDSVSVTAAQSVSVSVTGAIGAVEPGPPEPPSEVDIPATSRSSTSGGTGQGPGEGGEGGNDFDPSLGLGKDHPGTGAGGGGDHLGDHAPGEGPGPDHGGDHNGGHNGGGNGH